MGRRKKEQEWFAPGGSDMTTIEALDRVISLAEKSPEAAQGRNVEAVKLVKAIRNGRSTAPSSFKEDVEEAKEAVETYDLEPKRIRRKA